MNIDDDEDEGDLRVQITSKRVRPGKSVEAQRWQTIQRQAIWNAEKNMIPFTFYAHYHIGNFLEKL